MSPQVILITGASSGLGAALARRYAVSGAILGLLGRDPARLEQVAAQCRQQGADVQTACLDVTDAKAMADWLLQFDQAHPIDLCIANAGISAGSGGGGESLEQARHIFDVNLHGVMNTIHPIMDRMLPRGTGQIALISSIAGFRGLPTAPAYSASKGAVRLYGQALRTLLLPKGIAVSVVCPGFIKTPMTDVNPFPMPLIMSAEKAAHFISRKLRHKPALLAFPWPIAWLMRLQSLLPEMLLLKIYNKIPGKPAK
jgi:short-subunit dehydrogenase